MIQNGGGLTDSACVNHRMPKMLSRMPTAAADRRQHEHLREVLADDATTGGAERHANGHLALAKRRARDEQVGHVHAGDEQHADAGPEHRVEQAVNLRTEDGLRVRHHVGADAAVGLRELILELRADAREPALSPERC